MLFVFPILQITVESGWCSLFCSPFRLEPSTQPIHKEPFKLCVEWRWFIKGCQTRHWAFWPLRSPLITERTARHSAKAGWRLGDRGPNQMTLGSSSSVSNAAECSMAHKAENEGYLVRKINHEKYSTYLRVFRLRGWKPRFCLRRNENDVPVAVNRDHY